MHALFGLAALASFLNTPALRSGSYMSEQTIEIAAADSTNHVPVQLMAVMGPTFGITDIDDRTAARKDMMKAGGKLHKHFEVIDKLLAKSSTQYYLGADMGLADTVVFVGACQLGGGCGFYATLTPLIDAAAAVNLPRSGVRA